MTACPTADDVAAGIVAACRETDDDPIACAERERSGLRARHYVMHALRHVFCTLTTEQAARLSGCTGNPGTVYAISTLKCFRKAAWWDERAYCRIVWAIQESADRRKLPGAAPPAASPAAEKLRPKFRLVEKIVTRQVPTGAGPNMNHLVFNDPPPGRSALDAKNNGSQVK